MIVCHTHINDKNTHDKSSLTNHPAFYYKFNVIIFTSKIKIKKVQNIFININTKHIYIYMNRYKSDKLIHIYYNKKAILYLNMTFAPKLRTCNRCHQ